jgi:hypothetical protein
MKSHTLNTLISLVLSGLLLPFSAAAQNYDEQGYAEEDSSADSTPLRYGSGMGLKKPAFWGRYYQFGKYLGAEFGNIKNGDGLSTPYAFASKSRNLMGIGTLPIGDKFSLFGKFGVAKSISYYGQNLSAPSYMRERSPDLTYGIGLKYNYNPNLALHLGWDRYNSLGGGGEDSYNSQNEVRWFSLGLGLKF